MSTSTAHKTHIKNIIVKEDRGRKNFKGIEELTQSVKAHGLIHPIVVAHDSEQEGKYLLIAGERRYRACILAGFVEIDIRLREDIDDLEMKEIELEENVKRSDLSWPEQCELLRQIDEIKRVRDPGWTNQQTAEVVNLTSGHVSYSIKLAKRFKEEPGLLKEVGHLPIRAAMQVLERKDQAAKVERLQKSGQFTASTNLRLGNCLDLIKDIPDASIDLLLTDPPYGLERLNDLIEGGSSSMTPGHKMMSKTHNLDLKTVLELLQSLAPEFKRVLKPGAHLYIFTAYQYIGDFVKALGDWFIFQPPVLHWDREKATIPGYGYNYMNRTEAIIHGHRDPRTKRLKDNQWNILVYKEVPRNERKYPTEKPIGLLKQLIEQSTMMGDTILDPFAGSASTLKAGIALQRNAIGFEINEEAWRRAQDELVNGVSKTNGK